MRRLVLIGAALAAVGAGASIALLAKMRYVNPYRPRLEQVSFPLPAGHADLAGLTIGFITDTHASPFTAPRDIRRAVDLLIAAAPDIMLFGGDYVSESPRFIPGAIGELARAARAAPLGALAVLGNHDLSLSGDKVTRAFAAAGIPVLRNEARRIDTGKGAIWIAGIDETLIGCPDIEQTFDGIPGGAAVLALWHEPEFAEQAARAGAFAQLSGHTHGGQVRLPFIGPLRLPADGRRHTIGLSDADGMPVYTSRGMGIYRPPVRLCCPPEVTLVTLAPPIPRDP